MSMIFIAVLFLLLWRHVL